MKVAVVGAGLSGLVSLKECLEEGFTVDVFEAQDHIGGQWAYEVPSPEKSEVWSSVYDGVVLNSCRDTSCFSDFPLDPARYPDFFGHRLHLKYLTEYATHFDLMRHIQLSTKVLGCKQTQEGKWIVTYLKEGGSPIEETYDALFACTGHNSFPRIPEFPGKETFKGEILHSHVYRTPGRFEGKRVAVVGIGASAADIACEIGPHAEELHVITRRGTWIIPRYCLGKPAEAWASRLSQTVLPSSVAQWLELQLLLLTEGEHPPELKPKHKILEAVPTIRGDFLERIRIGQIKIHRAGVEKFTPNGLITSTGEELEVDTIILCTGYKMEFPYLPADSYQSERDPNAIDAHNKIELYEFVHSVRYKNLFVIGMVEVPGPLAPASEAQARWSVGVLTKRVTLPSLDEMAAAVKVAHIKQAKTYVRSERHSTITDFLPYLDRLLKPLGANPTFGRLFANVFTSGHPLQALSLMNAVYMQICAPSQYRLFGYKKSPELATATFLRTANGKKEMSEVEKRLIKRKE